MSKFEQYVNYTEQKFSFLNKGFDDDDVCKFIIDKCPIYSLDDKLLYNFNNYFYVNYIITSLAKYFNENNIQLDSDKALEIEKAGIAMLNDNSKTCFETLKKEYKIDGYLDIDTLKFLLYKEPGLRKLAVEIFGEELINEEMFPSSCLKLLEELNVIKSVYESLIKKREIEELNTEEVKEKYIEKFNLRKRLNELKEIKNKISDHEKYEYFNSIIKELEINLEEVVNCEDEKMIEGFRKQLFPEETIKYESENSEYITINTLLQQKEYYGKKLKYIEDFLNSDILEEFKKERVLASSYHNTHSRMDSLLNSKYGHLRDFVHDTNPSLGIDYYSVDDRIDKCINIERNTIETARKEYEGSIFLRLYKKNKFNKLKQEHDDIWNEIKYYWATKESYKKAAKLAHKIKISFSDDIDADIKEMLDNCNSEDFISNYLVLIKFLDSLKEVYSRKYNDVLSKLKNYNRTEEDMDYYSTVNKAVEMFEEDNAVKKN